MTTPELMDLLLEPAQALRRELGVSFDLVCVPEAQAAADLAQAKREAIDAYFGPMLANVKRDRQLQWMHPDGRWLCSLHDRENCEACRGS